MSYATAYPGRQAATHRVLRNTLMLLAASLIPTVLGVVLATVMGLPAIMSVNPILSLVCMLVFMVGSVFLLGAVRNTRWAVPVLLAFTFGVGMILSISVGAALGRAGIGVVILSLVGTMGMLVGCINYVLVTQRDFSGWGKYLMGACWALVALGVTNMFLQVSVLSLVISAVALVVFSMFLLYDLQQVVNGGETNYVMATLSIYLDLVNIFQSLLNLLGFVGSDD